MPAKDTRPWPDSSRVSTVGPSHYHGEPAGTCGGCGKPLAWRVGEKTGRAYKVELPSRQFHPRRLCPGNVQQIGTIQETIQTLPQRLRDEIDDELELDSGETVPAAPRASQDGLAALIASVVAPLLPKPMATVDEATVQRLIDASLTKQGARSIEVTVRDSGKAPINVGRQHERFPLLLTFMGRRRNVWMVGPAGSGKTSAAKAAAKALGLEFGSISVGPQTTQSSLFGYPDATGYYVSTEFFRRYRDGGAFLWDEIDRGNPGVLTSLNQGLENGECAFPMGRDRDTGEVVGGMVQRHPDFIGIAAGNTYGRGASREYVGALQIDAATIDRFTMLWWDYDEQLEWDIASATYAAAGGTDSQVFSRWVAKVRRARSRAAELGIRHIASPRASIVGADYLAVGVDEATVAECVLWKGADADTVARLS